MRSVTIQSIASIASRKKRLSNSGSPEGLRRRCTARMRATVHANSKSPLLRFVCTAGDTTLPVPAECIWRARERASYLH